jgi:hypothetical protein
MADMSNLLDAMRLGRPEDLYYVTSDTSRKQSIATLVDNRFQYGLTQLAQGSSTIILSPDQGISDIVLAMKLPAQGAGQAQGGGACNYAGLALPRSWGYAMLNRLSVRYAGSSQYFFTGSQVLIQNLREASNPVSRDQIFYLGGSALAGAAAAAGDFAVADNLWSYIYLNMPHCSPNGSSEKPKPLPSELLTMPVVITIELNNPSTVFSSAVALGSVAGAPSALEFGSVQIKQIHARDRGQLMSPSADGSKGYSLPVIFYQNQIDIPLSTDAGGVAQTTLTGLRAGDMTHIIAWLTDNDDTNPNRAAPFVYQPFNFAQIYDPSILYNGTVYFTARNEAARLWNVVSSDVQSEVPGVALSLPGGGVVGLGSPAQVTWLEVPFAQVMEQISATHTLVHGLPVSNAVINMTLTVPDPAQSYTLHVVYVYNAALFMSRGNAEYVF